jgi:RND superfamily putative drug exporter
MMSRAARFGVRRPKLVIAGWSLFVIVFGLWGGGLLGNKAVQDKLLPTRILVNGTDSNRADELAKGHFGEKFALLLTGPADEIEKQGRPLARALATRPNTTALSPWSNATGAEKLRPRPDQAVITLDVRLRKSETVSTFIPPLKRFIEQRVSTPVVTHLSGLDEIGRAQNDQVVNSIHDAEKLAFPVLVIVLLLVFRTPLAAAVPLIMGLATARAGFGVLNIVADHMRLDAVALSMASMIGITLGVDYSLLIVSRFREALVPGQSVAQAASLAANTAGRTAAFAGFVLLSMMLVVIVLSPGTIMLSAAIGAMVVTILSMIAAVLVTPGIVRLAGHRVNAFRLGGMRTADKPGMIDVVVRRVTGRPLLAALSVGAIALLIASPVLALPGNMIPPDPRQLPPGDGVLKDYLAIRDAGFGPEVNIILKAPGGTLLDGNRVKEIRDLQRQLERIPDAKFVVGPNQIAQQTAAVRRLPEQLRGAEKQVTVGKTKLAELERGLGRATHGVSQLRSGLGRAANGAQQLDNGALLARNGAQRIATGNRQVRQGFGRLEDGLRRALDGASRLASGTTRARKGSARIVDGNDQLYHGLIDQLAPGAERLAAGLRQGKSGLESLRVPAQTAERETRNAWDRLNAMTVGKSDPLFQPTLEAVSKALGAMTGHNPLTGQDEFPGYQGMDASLKVATEKAGLAADGAARIAAGARQAADGARRLRNGSVRLRHGLRLIEEGMSQLRDGIRQMSDAVQAAAPNVRRLEVGTGQLASGLGSIQGGTRQLAGGLSEGVVRSEPLETGLGSAYTGIGDFRHKLTGPGGSLNLLDRFKTLQKRSPNLFESGFLPIAAVAGSRLIDRQPSQFLLDTSHGGNVGSIQVLPNVPTNDPRTDRLVSRIRKAVGDFRNDTGLEAATGGSAAQLVDYKSIMKTRIPLLVIGICLVTYLMLVPIMRSLLLPAIAVVLNLITVGMGFGILVLLFAVGDDPLLGGAGALDVIAVGAIFAISFALSIDYQVFLLTRMREEFVRTQSNDAAIEFGISKTATIVTGAALIMIAVFSAFALAKFVTIKMFGIGLASCVLIDATLIRLVLLPAVMRLFGLNTWWISNWLDERLPLIDVTGAEFEHEQEQMPPS